MSYEEAKRAVLGEQGAIYYQKALERSKEFREDYDRRKGVVKAEEMPWEDSPQGRIKHVINEELYTRECALDIYQQEIPPGSRSGKHRHMSEEVFFVLEGTGYDLHWDVNFDCQDKYIWDWEKEPKEFTWEEGDFIYIPPYTMHQHFNSNLDKPARIIVATSRIIRALGFDWMEQLENAPEYQK